MYEWWVVVVGRTGGVREEELCALSSVESGEEQRHSEGSAHLLLLVAVFLAFSEPQGEVAH